MGPSKKTAGLTKSVAQAAIKTTSVKVASKTTMKKAAMKATKASKAPMATKPMKTMKVPKATMGMKGKPVAESENDVKQQNKPEQRQNWGIFRKTWQTQYRNYELRSIEVDVKMGRVREEWCWYASGA